LGEVGVKPHFGGDMNNKKKHFPGVTVGNSDVIQFLLM
jgi:hypothetical protein